ncbi:MAG: homoserine O-succinyltransferase [Clostridia bacterium]|nr:homoserine O-succinyltransferase [Clostridia bacterium]
MPIKVPNNLPATRILDGENIFVMTERRALHQDIRPLKLLIVNIMPTKIKTETQLLRALSNTPLQIEVEFVNMASHTAQNTPPEHLQRFYKTFDEVRTHRYDGVIITGAPVEHLEFESVDYWDELCNIMAWTKTHATSTFHICWAAQAALYFHYGIKKHPLRQKMFGVFEHRTLKPRSRLTRGFNDVFFAPHSRHAYVKREDIEAIGKLEILCESDEAGVYLVKSSNDKQVFVMGHSEYEFDTLDEEYRRDLKRGASVPLPKHYYPQDDPSKTPPITWRSHNHLLFSNWLNYFVYQTTPYELKEDAQK